MSRSFARLTALLALGNVVLTGTVLWGLSALDVWAPRPAGSGASVATQRLADAYAYGAFRYVITNDYAALNAIIRQSTSWPELVYLSVEDARGRILAHSDPARVGQVWNTELAQSIRSTVRVAYDDVVAVIADPSTDPRNRTAIGRLRLGFISDATLPAPPHPPVPLWAALLTALVLALPMAFVITRLGPSEPAEAEPAQVTRLVLDLKEVAGEAQRLRSEQARSVQEMARLQGERARLAEQLSRLEQQLVDERAAAVAAAEQGRDAAYALRRELDHRATEAVALRGEPERESPGSATLTPPALGEGQDDPDVAQAARQGQYRAVAHISHVVRHSLTTILGFSRLLLRDVDGELNVQQRTDVENIHRAGGELLAFIAALSELARADLGSLPIRRQQVSLGRLLAETAQKPDVAGVNTIGVAVEDATLVEADPVHLGRALHLLLQHAVADAQPGGVVATARAQDGTATVEVAYPRSQVTPEEVDRLFSPFGPASVRDAASVRLTLARALTVLNGGRLAAEPGDRSIAFTLSLPQDGHRSEARSGRGEGTRETARR